MAEYQNLQATINAVIKANGVQAITGPVLNAVLNSMVTVLGDGYRFGGVAAPADNPGSPDNRVAYLASQAGTYTNFGGLTLSGEVALLCWDSAWTKETLFSIDAAPTPGSDNLISSGAVDTALTNLANSIAAAYMQLVPAAVEDHLASYDNAGQVKDSGIAAGDVVLKGGAYLGLFAGYAANLVDTRSAGTPQGPYAFRQSGGDGVDYMVRIKGRTEAFNQLVSAALVRSSATISDVVFTNNNDGSITINGTASADISTSLLAWPYLNDLINGHSYYVSTGKTSPTGVTYKVGGTPFTSGVVFTYTGSTSQQYITLEIANGTTVNITLYPQFVDLTLEGLGLTTAAQFQSLHPLPYYAYDAGVLKNNAATGIKTRGFNQWDGTVVANSFVNPSTGETAPSVNYDRSDYIPVIGGQTYYIRGFTYAYAYDAGKNFLGALTIASYLSTLPANAAYVILHTAFQVHISDKTLYWLNRSDASRNGTYEPYWEREIVLGLDNLACHDENNNAVTLNGLDGVGSSYDEAVVENGMVTKIVKRFAEVDLGDLGWIYATPLYPYFRSDQLLDAKPGVNSQVANIICQKYIAAAPDNAYQGLVSYCACLNADRNVNIYDPSAGSDPAAFKTAMSGVKLRYELATPKVLTVDNPFPAFVEVDNLGTQERLPADTAADPRGPFESDSNYSVSTANLVRALGL